MKKVISILILIALVFTVCIPQPINAATTNYNYGEALQKAIMFYEFQRSGDLPDNINNNWRGDSGLNDGSDAGLDLTGGWYDAGDHVKFNLPMAYTAATLGWAVYEERATLETSGQLNKLMDEIKWACDYLIKCHPSPNVYYYQVGDGNADHSWWGPAEVMQMTRPSYKVDSSNPGSTVVAETAAALAVASIIFKDTNSQYSATCLSHAKDLFTFADTTKSDAGYKAATDFYKSWSGFYDELSWAATWLYLATNDQNYLTKAESYVSSWGTEPQTTTIAYKYAQSWDDVHYGAALLLARITNKALYKEGIERHLDWWTTGYNGEKISYTPKGLAWLAQWGSLRYASTTAFLAAIYADWSGCSATKAATYKNFLKSQLDYCLGSAGRSFEVGFGTNPPTRPHHRTAHSSWADSQTVPNYHRHTIYGALVGGPGNDDSYADDISDYIKNEIACDYNAGFVGALTKLYKQYGGTPIANFKAIETKTNDEFFVEAGVNASGSNFIEIKALMNNKSGWPARMGDKLSFKYFIDITEAVKAGYSANDITVSANYNQGATLSKLIPFDAANNIYYVNVDFTGTKIYPGGQSAYRKEVQMRISGPANTSFWDNSNDYSFTGITSSAAQTPYIPVYDNGVKVYGDEPGVVNSSSISPTSATFDKNTTKQADISVTMTLNGNTFNGIKNGSTTLVSGTDYTVSGNVVKVLKSYLAKQPVGTTNLTFDFSAGIDRVLSITVSDTTPSSSISPTTATFDKVASKQADIAVTMTLNGNTFNGIKNGTTALVSGTDYTVSGSTVTILKGYLATLPLGVTNLTFDFSAGNDPALEVTVTDSSMPAGNIKIQFYNSNTSAQSNTIYGKYKVVNTGTTSVDLSKVKIRYYYTVNGEKAQNFWVDWSPVGGQNVTGTFVKLTTPKTNTDYYLEIGFTSGAGSLAAGQSIEVQTRIAKSDWTDYTQTDDYSFNSTATTFVDWNKVTAYSNGTLVWGVEP